MTSKNKFILSSKMKPEGDQGKAILELMTGFNKGYKQQTLFGVTGSGKTFTAANIINQLNMPTLVIAHNKTLAAQLAQEYSEFFPDNEVHYFVSYYDYYQPESYMPITDTYIAKEAQINIEIDRLRHASTQALLTRRDVIIVASVSCIYGIGNPEDYMNVNISLEKGQKCSRRDIMERLINIQYKRQNLDLTPGTFRVIGNNIEIMQVNEHSTIRIEINNDHLSSIIKIDAVSMSIIDNDIESINIFPAKHFMTGGDNTARALVQIKKELKFRLAELAKQGKLLEAERLKRRTNYDIALIREVGYCNGIENYSRHFSGKNEGEAPDTLLSYFPKKKDGSPDFLTIIDESHVTLSQIGAMYAGDRSRKTNLVDHGFRLPSARDNRPLQFEEFMKRIGNVLYTSATPGQKEKASSQQIVEQIIRPTGLLDPIIVVRPISETKDNMSQIEDLIPEIHKAVKNNERVLITSLTKKMAENLAEYLENRNIKTKYIHSDIKTFERIEILSDFRRGLFDCLVGVNLLREGLDLPEVALIAILDADKEGFLRSETSLIQIIGRAARNINGRVILYADRVTDSMKRAIDETARRREVQETYNKKNGITARSIQKEINDISQKLSKSHIQVVADSARIDMELYNNDKRKIIRRKKNELAEAVKILDFETASIIRDEIILITNLKKK